MALEPGTTLGHYEILSSLGAGSMGEVYRARDGKLGREVAIKVLPENVAQDSERLARFEIEARAVASLSHPNIVTIYSVENVDGLHFITMEYVDGQTLEELIPRGGLGLARFIELAQPVALALGAAHEQEITHRDVKPANVMVGRDDRVKVLDFGLAKLQREDGGDREAETLIQTEEGRLLGTVPYMSPEQVQGKGADHRSDIFSLGVVLYEMATGSRPFGGETAADLISAILRDAPTSITEHRADLPRALDRILRRCLEKDPKRRYQAALDLANDLADLRPEIDAAEPATSGASIVVLPFANTSSDPEQEYFCDGMAEEVINLLTQLEGLHVVARTSAFSFKGRDIDVREIGDKLGVRSVLEGSVRKAGDRLRITAELVNVADGYHLWSERFDRKLDDVFAIQDEISARIVESLKVQLLPEDRGRLARQPPENLDAYARYLSGRFYFYKFTLPDLHRSVEYFQQAIELDGRYARAHAGLARAYMFMGGAGPLQEISPREAYPVARAEVLKALELDPELAEAHTMLGALRAGFEWEWLGAEQAFKRAFELSPNDADSHFWHAWHLWLRGSVDPAIASMDRALTLDPLSLTFQSVRALFQYCARNYDVALAEFQRILASEPTFFHAQLHLGDTYLAKDLYREAEEAYRKATTLFGEHSWIYLGCCRLYAAWNRREQAEKYLEKMLALAEQHPVPHSHVAWCYLALGDQDRMFAWYDRAYEAHEPQAALQVMPWLDAVRSDPRFRAHMKRIGQSEQYNQYKST